MRACCCKSKQNRIITGVIFIVLLSNIALAGVGTESMQFLKIKPSARGASLGDGFVAVSDDVNAVFFNPAGLTQISALEISLMHMVYMADTSYEYASLAMPIGDNLRFGAYIIYLNYGSISKTSEDNTGMYQSSTESFSPNDLAVALSGAIRLGSNISLGVNLKYASESIDTLSLTGIMADAGILADLDGIKVGSSVYNIGVGNISNSPMGIRLGISSKIMLMAENDLTVALGSNYVPAISKMSGSIGVEWGYEEFLFLRSSYSLMSDSDSVNIGGGLKQDFGGMTGEIAYNFSMLGDLGSAHRISIGIKLGEGPGNYKGSKLKKSSGSKTAPKKNYSTPARKYNTR